MWRSLYLSRYATASRSSMMAETDKGEAICWSSPLL